MRREVLAGFIAIVMAGAPGAALADGSSDEVDLSVEILTRPLRAQPGQPIFYRVQVRNDGPGTAKKPVLTVQMPDGVKIAGPNVFSCRHGATEQEVVCPSTKEVAPGETGGVTITGIVRRDAVGPLRAVATLTSAATDVDETNNSQVSLVEVNEGADLKVQLAGTSRGKRFAVSAEVTNMGPGTVRDGRLFFKAGESELVAASGAECRLLSGRIGCKLPELASGDDLRVRLAIVAPRRPVDAKASVFSSRYGDRHSDDNVASMRINP